MIPAFLMKRATIAIGHHIYNITLFVSLSRYVENDNVFGVIFLKTY